MSDQEKNGARRLWLGVLGVVVAVGLIGYGLWWFLVARYYVSTDDAYVGGNVVTITSREPATVLALHADNTQTVRQGQLLIEMDPATANVNLQASQANLARVVRTVRGEFSKAESFQAQLSQAQVALSQAQEDYNRRKSAEAGAVSREELSHAEQTVRGAQANMSAARGSLDQTLSSIAGADVAHNPDVLAAEAQLRNVAITLSHMRIVAPVDGVIAQRTVQVGQQVPPGQPLMAVVPLSAVWIDANFKEGQLADMRVGQPVEITTDIYGGRVKFHGHVEGLGAGSGSAFALLPPQNASGNWIKIVQRVPVRISLDAKELADHPLRVGLSVAASVDQHDQSGPLITTRIGPGITRAQTGEDSTASADAMIARILRDNGGAAR
jgi:membrane fusion protein (multidrug efflux system)